MRNFGWLLIALIFGLPFQEARADTGVIWRVEDPVRHSSDGILVRSVYIGDENGTGTHLFRYFDNPVTPQTNGAVFFFGTKEEGKLGGLSYITLDDRCGFQEVLVEGEPKEDGLYFSGFGWKLSESCKLTDQKFTVQFRLVLIGRDMETGSP